MVGKRSKRWGRTPSPRQRRATLKKKDRSEHRTVSLWRAMDIAQVSSEMLGRVLPGAHCTADAGYIPVDALVNEAKKKSGGPADTGRLCRLHALCADASVQAKPTPLPTSRPVVVGGGREYDALGRKAMDKYRRDVVKEYGGIRGRGCRLRALGGSRGR